MKNLKKELKKFISEPYCKNKEADMAHRAGILDAIDLIEEKLKVVEIWRKRMNEYRKIMDNGNVHQKHIASAKFMILRDCIKEIEKL